MNVRLAVTVSVLGLSLTACAAPRGADDPNGAWVGKITTEGNVTTVVNESGSVLGGESDLVLEATFESDASPEHYVFTLIGALETDGEVVYVSDREASVVRVFDLDGAFIADLGGPGQGPGEFESPKGIGLTGGGRILVQDNSARKIHVFDADRTFVEAWARVWPSSTWDEGFTVTPDGRAFVREVLNMREDRPEGEEPDWGMLAWGPGGPTGEVVQIPRLQYPANGTVRWGTAWNGGGARVPFLPRSQWTFGRDTSLASGFPDVYEFEILHLDGSRTVVRRLIDPPRVQSEEWEWAKQNIVLEARAQFPTWTWNGPERPPRKPAFDGLFLDDQGRVWVLRELAGTHREPCAAGSEDLRERIASPCWARSRVFDIFDPQGRLLTTVQYAGDLSTQVRPTIRGDVVLVVEEDSNGNSIVRRYRFAPRADQVG